MKLLFQQKFFSWFDSYTVYDEHREPYFTVKGQLAWGHKFVIYDAAEREVGCLEEQIFRFLPHFTMYENGREVGEIVKELSFLRPRFSMTCSDWQVEGNWIEWDYEIRSQNRTVATLSKEPFNWTDTYVLDIAREEDALRVLMVVLAIDAVKCTRSSQS